MIGEFNILGILLPSLIPCCLVGFVGYIFLKRYLIKIDSYRHVWHPPLFNISALIICIGFVIGIFHFLTRMTL